MTGPIGGGDRERRRQSDLDLATLVESSDNLTTKVELLTQAFVVQATRLRKLRNAAILMMILSIVVGVVSSIVVYEVGHHQTHRLIDEAKASINSSRHDSCVASNQAKTEAATGLRRTFLPYLMSELALPHPEPVLLTILKTFARVQPQITACPPG